MHCRVEAYQAKHYLAMHQAGKISSQHSSAVHRAKENLATLSMVQMAPMYLEMLLAGSLLHLLLYTSKRELTWTEAALRLLYCTDGTCPNFQITVTFKNLSSKQNSEIKTKVVMVKYLLSLTQANKINLNQKSIREYENSVETYLLENIF